MLKNIFIGCMPFGFTERDIRAEFEPYGRVQSVELQQDLENATFDSFAHVKIDTDDADGLLNELDGKRICNRLLRVNEAVTRADVPAEEPQGRKAKPVARELVGA